MKKSVLEPTDVLLEALHSCLSETLHINKSRMVDVKFLDYKLVNETLIFNVTANAINPNQMFNLDLVELLKVQFVMRDRADFPDEKTETVVLFYFLNLLAIDERYFSINEDNDQVKLANVKDTTNVRRSY
jgi:hypothetical protein